MVGDAATYVAGRANPPEEQLAQIDQAAEDNTWHEAPNLSAGNIKSQMKAVYDKHKPFGRETAQNVATEASQATSGSTDPVDTANAIANGNVDKADVAAGATTGARNLKEQASANVPEDTKERAQAKRHQLSQSTKNYLSGKMPQERREQTVWRLKKMVVEIQGHEDCKDLY